MVHGKLGKKPSEVFHTVSLLIFYCNFMQIAIARRAEHSDH